MTAPIASDGRWNRRVSVLALIAAAACGDAKTELARGRLEIPIAAFDVGGVPLFNERAQSIEVRNAGRAPLLLTSVSLQATAGAPGAFTLASAPASLEAGQSGHIEVRFVPQALADFAAVLTVASDDPLNPSADIALSGRGSAAAALQADSSIDFGRVCEGSEALGWLTVRSLGNADLIVQEIRLEDGTAPEYQFASSTRGNTSVPVGSSLQLPLRFSPTAATGANPAGAVVLATTDPAHRSLRIPLVATVNRAPRPAIASPSDSAPGAAVSFDARGTSDPDNDLPLTFTWSLKSSPVGSTAQPAPFDGPQTSLSLDLPGPYEVALAVRDAAGCAAPPALAQVLAKPGQGLLVELVWDNPLTDLDLHLAPEGADLFGPSDCYFGDGHRSPDWGVLGDSTDDPSLDRDALVGFGPEIIGYPRPAPGRYHAMVHFFSDHGAKSPASAATIRVYELGVVKAEMKKTLTAQGEQWPALTIDWPSGAVVALP